MCVYIYIFTYIYIYIVAYVFLLYSKYIQMHDILSILVDMFFGPYHSVCIVLYSILLYYLNLMLSCDKHPLVVPVPNAAYTATQPEFVLILQWPNRFQVFCQEATQFASDSQAWRWTNFRASGLLLQIEDRNRHILPNHSTLLAQDGALRVLMQVMKMMTVPE